MLEQYQATDKLKYGLAIIVADKRVSVSKLSSDKTPKLTH